MYIYIYIHGNAIGNSLCSYLKQTKMSFFFLLQNWRAEHVLPQGVGSNGRGKEVGEGVGE
jgi:hypothetical protein